MKVVTYRDDQGFLHRSIIREDMRSDQAIQGIPADPPDILQLDWEELKKKLHNQLVELGLISIKDLQNNNLIASAILTTFQRPLTDLYRNQAAKKNGHNLGGTNG